MVLLEQRMDKVINEAAMAVKLTQGPAQANPENGRPLPWALLYLARAADSPPREASKLAVRRIEIARVIISPSCHSHIVHYLAVACIYSLNPLPIRAHPFLGPWGFFLAGSAFLVIVFAAR
jgi:hypothetical protein